MSAKLRRAYYFIRYCVAELGYVTSSNLPWEYRERFNSIAQHWHDKLWPRTDNVTGTEQS